MQPVRVDPADPQSASFIIISGSHRAIWGKSIIRAIPIIKTPRNGKIDL
jgi:hypothetical protein